MQSRSGKKSARANFSFVNFCGRGVSSPLKKNPWAGEHWSAPMAGMPENLEAGGGD
jgi:hypothetical protein